ncbi:uncharacterized protein [Melopsittacus undulatus]|uniref:uncharacterized protein n=1 Tax=Melopsittacus undulatus TaxID=13146 RepID=UPI00146EA1FC|nr:uncharacterized protein LOC117438355 [Melopsittacus undulatus]
MDVVHKAVAAMQARAEQEKEQEDVAQSHVDVSVAPATPVTLEDIETPMAVEPQAEPSSAPFTKAADEAGEVMVSPVPGDYQQEAGRAVVSPAQHEEEVLAAVTMIPGAESGISYLAPGADDEGEAAASPLSQGSQPQEEPAAFPEENDEEAKQELDCVSDKELSQGEALTMYNICVSPLVPELFQDSRADIHLESSIRSNVGTNATSEAAGDLQSVLLLTNRAGGLLQLP